MLYIVKKKRNFLSRPREIQVKGNAFCILKYSFLNVINLLQWNVRRSLLKRAKKNY